MAAKEDNFLELKKHLKNGDIGNLYLLYGEEAFVKNLYRDQLEKTVPDDGFGDFNRIILDGKEITTDKIDDALNSFPMMAEKKLVVIKNSGVFKSASEELKAFWQERLSDIPDYVLLIFDEQEVDKRGVLYKAASKAGLCVEFKFMKDYEIAAWVVREAQKAGKKIGKSEAEYLVSMCDPGISNVKNELDKLISYSGDEIYKSDIDKAVSKPLSIVIFEVTDAMIEGNSDKAMSVIIRMREGKESAFNILYLLSSAFDKMLHAKLLLNEGATYDMISSKLKVAPFIARKYIDGAKGFSEYFLRNRIIRTAECDMAIKQGEKDEWSALFEYVFEALKK